MFEIRIEHAVREDGIRLPSLYHLIGAEAVVLPQAVDDHAIEAFQVFL